MRDEKRCLVCGCDTSNSPYYPFEEFFCFECELAIFMAVMRHLDYIYCHVPYCHDKTKQQEERLPKRTLRLEENE